VIVRKNGLSAGSYQIEAARLAGELGELACDPDEVTDMFPTPLQGLFIRFGDG
jgi:hypothetical protein